MKRNAPQYPIGLTTAVASFLLLGIVLPAPAAEETLAGESPAKALVDANCGQCHGSEVYTRDDRRVQSFSDLENQVQRCETALELKWFDDDVMAVATLLNDRYYHFAR